MASSDRSADRSSLADAISKAASCLLLALAAEVAFAQHAVRLETAGREWVPRNAAFEIVITPPIGPEEGRPAFLLGATDVTDLFRRTVLGYAYRPELMRLPVGEGQLAVYLVTPGGEWVELGRAPLRVLRTGGFETVTATPRLDLTADDLLSTGSSRGPGTARERVNLQADFQGSITRSGWSLEPRVNVVGASLESNALRFGQLGNDAPQVDLSSYSVALRQGGGSLQLGQQIYGEHRHLIRSFSGRGLQLRLPLVARRLDVSIAAMSGSQIVGWDNPTGLANQDHRILTGVMGFDLVASRPGALRIEGSFMDGRVLPQAGFNQGAVTDAEESRGWGVRLLASTTSQRVRFEGGWARSRFTNPSDPKLSQGEAIVKVQPETRDASYLELSLGLVQTQTKKGRPLNLSLAVRHARVAPQYRTVTARFQADREEDLAELAMLVGPVVAQASYTLAEDNLDRIPSILTTRTRRAAANVSLPLRDVLARTGGGAAWLPSLSYTLDRTHQFGTGVPKNGDFTEPFVPNQVSFNQTGSLDWNAGRYRAALRLGLSDQDNRQSGRERADLRVFTSGVSLGGSPAESLTLGLEAARDLSKNLEFGQETETRRYGLNITWQVSKAVSCSSLLSWSQSEDHPSRRESGAWNADAQVSWRFDLYKRERHGFGGRLFARYVVQESNSRDSVTGVSPAARSWRVSSGLGLSFF